MGNQTSLGASVLAVSGVALFTMVTCTGAMARKPKGHHVTNSTQRSDASHANIEVGPPPKEGSPEWRKLEARKKADQRRLDRAMGNICRGC